MRKEIFDNILKCGTWAISSDFLAEDKKRIFEVMSEKGMSDGTAYNRFFRDGFSAWELKGIRRIISEYAMVNAIEFEDISTFYSDLSKKTPFKHFMYRLGMSEGTVICRFSGFNFKPWELEGIESIILKELVDA